MHHGRMAGYNRGEGRPVSYITLLYDKLQVARVCTRKVIIPHLLVVLLHLLIIKGLSYLPLAFITRIKRFPSLSMLIVISNSSKWGNCCKYCYNMCNTPGFYWYNAITICINASSLQLLHSQRQFHVNWCNVT